MGTETDNGGPSQEKRQSSLHKYLKQNQKKTNNAAPDLQGPPPVQRQSGLQHQSDQGPTATGKEDTSKLNKERKEQDGDQIMGASSSPARPAGKGDRIDSDTPNRGGPRKKSKQASDPSNSSVVVSPNQDDKGGPNQDTNPTEGQQVDSNNSSATDKGTKQEQDNDEAWYDDGIIEEDLKDQEHGSNNDQDQEQLEDQDQDQGKRRHQGDQGSTASDDQEDAGNQANGKKKTVSFGAVDLICTIDLSKKITADWRSAYSNPMKHKEAPPFTGNESDSKTYDAKLKELWTLLNDELIDKIDRPVQHLPLAELQKLQKDSFRCKNVSYILEEETRKIMRKMVSRTAKTPPSFFDSYKTTKTDKATLSDTPLVRWWVAPNRLMGGAWRYEGGDTDNNWSEAITDKETQDNDEKKSTGNPNGRTPTASKPKQARP